MRCCASPICKQPPMAASSRPRCRWMRPRSPSNARRRCSMRKRAACACVDEAKSRARARGSRTDHRQGATRASRQRRGPGGGHRRAWVRVAIYSGEAALLDAKASASIRALGSTAQAPERQARRRTAHRECPDQHGGLVLRASRRHAAARGRARRRGDPHARQQDRTPGRALQRRAA